MLAIHSAIRILFEITKWLIFARVIISWLPVSKDNKYIVLLYQLTEPILAPIRNIIAKSSFGKNMMMDFSPILAFLLLGFIENILLSIF